MRRYGCIIHQLQASALAWLIFVSPAHAYVDPGTTGMILQLLIGGLIGALVVVKVYWQRLKDFLFRNKAAPTPPDQQGE